ncbi:hypothetical protein AYM40_06825 [Paraburkholderia phytofirmans OLGA172]|uniref:Uncharacterized protein n=1 Tax=Paraburkholderia phytofirmans OLGA172 TaxID=1417228 RepID=A0A160FJJ6_9BURK|nr:hypothetical protein AYM40_06825 [Paraburkholderia phytofirmans OLGA172]
MIELFCQYEAHIGNVLEVLDAHVLRLTEELLQDAPVNVDVPNASVMGILTDLESGVIRVGLFGVLISNV